MNDKIEKKIDEIIETYESVVKVIDKKASEEEKRAYGGVIRSVKGLLQEYITEEIIKLAWDYINGKTERLNINSIKHKIP